MTTSSTESLEPTTGRAARLRDATADVHLEAERAPFIQDLLGGRLVVDDYARLVVQHHAIYSVLERAVGATADERMRPLFAPELARMAAIEADLEHLRGPDWRASAVVLDATAAYVKHLEAVSTDSVRVLAHHYVRYLGDLSGGQVVGRVLQRVFEFPDERGTSFYRFPAIASPKAFKVQYRDLLDDLALTDGEEVELIDEATLAYRLNTAIFLELSPLPILAAAAHDRVGDAAF